MRNKIIFALSIIGIVAGLVAAYIFGIERKPQPPVFKPASSPYESAIYANGIIESEQPSGANINIYPEVSGPITRVLVREGQRVSAGTPLLTIDDSVQRATTEQLKLQSEAALALLEELKAQPRQETLVIAKAQVELAESNLKVARDQYDKRRASYDIDPKSISKDVLDTAEDTVNQTVAGLDVARKQYELTKAGAWSYDITNQEKQYEALKQGYDAANALLQKYSLKALGDGVVLLSIQQPTELQWQNGRVESSARAGVAAFGSTVRLDHAELECNTIQLDAEPIGQRPASFADLGGNVCGCQGEHTECQAVTTSLEPPLPPE